VFSPNLFTFLAGFFVVGVFRCFFFCGCFFFFKLLSLSLMLQHWFYRIMVVGNSLKCWSPAHSTSAPWSLQLSLEGDKPLQVVLQTATLCPAWDTANFHLMHSTFW